MQFLGRIFIFIFLANPSFPTYGVYVIPASRLLRHSRESGNPSFYIANWIPNQVGNDVTMMVGNDVTMMVGNDVIMGTGIRGFICL